ncbi:MAG: hypothetical protein KF732_09445 [Flavobacteriales bacterium]|nr:hypothetical protein [Flavobacteriales bacterium]
MKNTLFKICMVVALIFFSCTDNVNEEKNLERIEIKKYHPNGQLSLKGFYIGDSTNYDGNLTTYFEDGTIANEYVFKNGLQEGLQKYYYETGILEGIREYKNGIIYGTVEDYFTNGNKKSTGFSQNGKLYGRVNYYYESGKIKSYGCVDVLEKTFYLIKWNEEGKKIQETGRVFSTNYEYLPVENNKTSSGIILKVAVAEPPERKTIIMMNELNQPLKGVEIKDYSVNFKTEIGRRVVIKGIIKDLNDSILMEDIDTITVKIP